MDPITVDNNVANISNLETSIAELDKFIEAQRSDLCKIQHETKSLEELKRQAVEEPNVILRDILAGEHNALKFSNATLGLSTNIPEIDWRLIEANDVNPVALTRQPEAGTSRIDKMKTHIFDFRQALAQLPPLPTELLDSDDVRDADERGKKRRRIDPASRGPTAAPSSALRLPHADCNSDARSQCFSLAKAPRFPEARYPSTSSSTSTGGRSSTKPEQAPQTHVEKQYLPQRTWASKGVDGDTGVRRESPKPTSPTSPTSQDTLSTPTRSNGNPSVAFAVEEPMAGLPGNGENPSTFKQNWTLAEQHTLERLLVEIPSTVKFRWVRISEAMGGTRTPRQVASRVQKYYEKMKKLGVAVNSAEMGGGGRGGSKATETLDTPPSMRARGPSSRGKPKTGPQYTKSGRRR